MLGETLALLAALTWSTSVVLFGMSKQNSPLAMNLFKNSVASVLLLASMAVLGIGFSSDRSSSDWALLTLSGVIGIVAGDTLLFMALRRLGPGLLAIVECGYAPSMVAMSVLFLGEPFGLWLVGGGTLVIVGVMLASTEKVPLHLLHDPDRRVFAGTALGLLSMLVMSAGIVMIKPLIERGNLIEVSAVRLFAGVAAQLSWLALVPRHRRVLRVFVPNRSWRTMFPASVLSGYVAMLMWIGGFKWAAASVAAVLNQTSSVFTIILARILLREPITPRRALGAVLAIAGVYWIIAAG